MIKTILAVVLMATINTNNLNKEGMYAKIKTNKGDWLRRWWSRTNPIRYFWNRGRKP